jgi:hypothetical protein
VNYVLFLIVCIKFEDSPRGDGGPDIREPRRQEEGPARISSIICVLTECIYAYIQYDNYCINGDYGSEYFFIFSCSGTCRKLGRYCNMA